MPPHRTASLAVDLFNIIWEFGLYLIVVTAETDRNHLTSPYTNPALLNDFKY